MKFTEDINSQKLFIEIIVKEIMVKELLFSDKCIFKIKRVF